MRRKFLGSAKLLKFLLLACAVAGPLLKGEPADIDRPFSLLQLIGTFVVFAEWSISLCLWGNFLSNALSMQRFHRGFRSLLLGTVFYSCVAWAAGYLGLLHYDFVFIATGITLAALLLPLREPPVEALKSEERSDFRIALAIGTVYFLGRIIWASVLHGGSDPLMAYLLGPRYFSDLGSIDYSHRFHEMMTVSYWEYLYLWGNWLLGASGGKGLIEGQYFGQWLHQLAWVGIFFALCERLKSEFSNHRSIALIISIAFAESHAFLLVGPTSKNDFGVMFWLLSSAILLLARERRWTAVAGFLFGWGLIAKATSVFSCAAIAGVALFLMRSKRDWFSFGAMALLGMLPEMIRNAFVFGTPVPFLFQSLIDADWNTVTPRGIYRAPRWGDPGTGLKNLINLGLHDYVLILSFMASLVSSVFRSGRERMRRYLPELVVGWGGALLYSSQVFKTSFPRWLGLSFLMVVLTGALLFFGSIRSSRIRFAISSFLLVALVFLHEIQFNSWGTLKDIRALDPSRMIRRERLFSGGDSKAWLRIHLKPHELAVSTGEPALYYVSHLRTSVLALHPELDRATAKPAGALEIVRELRHFGVRYVWDTRHFSQGNYGWASMNFIRMAIQYPWTVAYAGGDSFVIDFDLLSNHLLPYCEKPDLIDGLKPLFVVSWL